MSHPSPRASQSEPGVAPRASSVPIANARMYSATPEVKAAWKDLLRWALVRAGLEWPVIDHDAPAPLGELWSRGDLGCAMMCGLPYSQRRPRPALIAAPIPSPARYASRPVYFTDIVVRRDSPHQAIEDTFGGIVGYTLEDSMSGCVALRAHLLPYRGAHGPRLYREAIGGLINARRVIEALDAGRIDVGPLDSYYHDLLRRSDPSFAGKVRTIASTRAAPIPPLIATAQIGGEAVAQLRAALEAAGEAGETAALRATLLLSGFAVPPESDYDGFGELLAASGQYPETW